MKKTTITNRLITLLLVIACIVSLAGCGASIEDNPVPYAAEPVATELPSPDANGHAFDDVPSWCADAADWAAAQGVAAGYGNGKFGPDDPCTNAQIVTMLWRAAGKQKATKTFPGTVESYYREAMDWAYSVGVVGETANGNTTCKRAGAAMLIWRAFGCPSASTSTGFSDVKSSDSYAQGYAQAVKWAVDNGIVAGVGNGKFDPLGSCTRGQIVTLLYRTYVPSARLNAGTTNTPSTPNTPSNNTADAELEKTLALYGDVKTLVKSVSNPTAPNPNNKKSTGYGTVDWSTAAQGYITFTADSQEHIFVLQFPDGKMPIFEVKKGETIKAILGDGTGTYQYGIGHSTPDGKAYYVDYKGSFTVDKMDTDLSHYLVSSPYGDYANAPKASAKAKELYTTGKDALKKIQALAHYVGFSLKYDKSLKQGTIDIYVNPDSVIDNGGVCNGMSKLLVAMLRSQGVPAYYQGGEDKAGGGHAWVVAWVEISSYSQNGTTYSKGAWVPIEATTGLLIKKDEYQAYNPYDAAN